MAKFTGVLLASDLDGTLIDDGRRLPGANRDALRYFMEGGGLFSVSTGRTPLGFEVMRPYIPVNAPCIMGNGSVLYDLTARRALDEWPLDNAFLPCIENLAADFPSLSVELHGPNDMFVWRHNAESQRHFDILEVPYTEVGSLREVPHPWYKCVLLGDAESFAAAAKMFRAKYGSRYPSAFSTSWLFEIFSPLAGKGNALERLVERLGIERRHVYAAGDQQNDWDMMGRFTSFAPSSGDPATVARAAYTVRGNNEGAIAGVIEILDNMY
jgi:hypothetical protein